jgi:transposase
VDAGRPIPHVAAEAGVSRRCLAKWYARWLADGEDGLHDPHVPPGRQPQTSGDVADLVEALRRQTKYGPARLASDLELLHDITLAPATVHRILLRRGLSRLRDLDPPTGEELRQVIRYEHDQPSDRSTSTSRSSAAAQMRAVRISPATYRRGGIRRTCVRLDLLLAVAFPAWPPTPAATPEFPQRAIPARAGNVADDPQDGPYPRGPSPLARGASSACFTPCVDKGPSPLARGACVLGSCRRHPRGSIPARAGSVHSRTATVTLTTVHPRSRGERSTQSRIRPRPKGPSPLARGAWASSCTLCGARRSIPARAGSVRGRIAPTARPRVHPRSRGERFCRTQGNTETEGSSPLARGACARPRVEHPHLGFIPARAGSVPVMGCQPCLVGFIPARAGSVLADLR